MRRIQLSKCGQKKVTLITVHLVHGQAVLLHRPVKAICLQLAQRTFNNKKHHISI